MDTLYRLFASTFDANPNVRKAAELEVRKLEQHEGMLSSTFQLVASHEAELPVRQAAAIWLKNKIRSSWDEERTGGRVVASSVGAPVTVSSSATLIAQSDREIIRGGILQALVVAPQQVRIHLASALGHIARIDFPKQWPNLVENIVQLIESSEPQAVYGGIRALLEVVRVYRYNLDTALLSPIVASTFPGILATGKRLLESPQASSQDVGELIYIILKTYKTSMVSHLTPHQQTNASIVPWGTFLLQVVQFQVDPSTVPKDEDSRQTCPWWKAKKWAFFSLNKLFARFGNPSQLPSSLKKYKPFADQFVVSFAPEILKVYLRLTEQQISGTTWLSQRAIHFIFEFYTECVKPKSTWALLKPHVNTLVSSFVFPNMCYRDEDEELWELDPVDFVRAHLDAFELTETVSASAGNFLRTVISKRTKTAFMPQLEFVTLVLNGFESGQRSSQEAEGALHMCLAMGATMCKNEKVSTMLDGFFAQHVIPKMRSEDRFLRFRACELVKSFDNQSMSWSNERTLEAAFQGIMACIADDELPVRMQAAEAIGELIAHDEVHAAMAPNAGRLMQELLKLSDETDLDVLTGTKEKIVEKFADELLPFAVELTDSMTKSYLRLVQENILASSSAEQEGGADPSVEFDFTKNEEDRMFAALGCLNTIYQVLAAAEGKPQILEQLEGVVLPAVAFTIENECIELFDDCFELTDILTFYQKKVSPGMWHVFELMCKSFDSAGIDYLAEMLNTLDNVVSFGKDFILANKKYRDLLLHVFETAMTNARLGASDHIAACKLADVVLLMLKGGLDDAVPGILRAILPFAAETEDEADSKALRKWSIVVILDSIIYNPALTLQHLQTESDLQGGSLFAEFLKSLVQISPELSRVHEKRAFVIAILGLLGGGAASAGGVSPESLAPQLQACMPSLFGTLLQHLKSLPEAVRKRRQMQNYFEDEEEEDEDEEDDGAPAAGWDDDADVVDEDNDYLELLARESLRSQKRAAKASAEANGAQDDEAFEDAEGEEEGDDDDEDDEDELDSDDEDEELAFESPLDVIPVYDLFRGVMGQLQNSHAAAFQALTGSLDQAALQSLQAVSVMRDEDLKRIQEEEDEDEDDE